MTCAGDSPASSRTAIASTSRTRLAISGTSRGERLALRAQLEEGARRAMRSRRHERVDEPPDLALGRGRRRGLDLLDAERRARAVLERELLELAQQALLAVADRGDERLRGAAPVELDAEPLGLAPTQRGSSRALSVLGDDVARRRP